MVATTESIAPADPRWRTHTPGAGGGVAPACALLASSGLEPDEAEPAVAIFSLPEISELVPPAGSGEPHRRLRWAGWIRRRVIHGGRVL